MADKPRKNWFARAVDAVAETETNPLALAWRMLPPEARKAYASLPNAVAELSPGAAIRDTVQASGETAKAAMQGRGWDAAGGVANMLAAAAGVVPGGRLITKGAKAANPLNDVLPRIGERPAGPYIPEQAPASLRERYSYPLSEAAGGKDPNRIKLNDKRIKRAAEILEQRHKDRTEFLSADPKATTQQMRDAVAFAEKAIRQGQDIKFKVPDGPYGSLYVKAGDNTVRFADHPQPKEGGKVVGGYSKTLGRRHYPADISVSPSESTLADVMALLRKYGLLPVAAGGAAVAANPLSTGESEAY